MKKKLGVVGVGTAGLISLMHFTTWLDKSWEVYSIHNPNKKILGIGESTNGGFVAVLEKGIGFSLSRQEDIQALEATLKFGSLFKGWRDEDFINPLLDGNVAIHFNNFRFQALVHKRLSELWPDQFKAIEGDVEEFASTHDKALLTIDGKEHEFDWVVDCTGFPKDYAEYTLSDCSPVTRCLVHNVKDFVEEPFTDHVATDHGWMFGIPLTTRKSYGYLFNEKITDKEVAIKDFMNVIGEPEDGWEGIEFKFRSYYVNRMINGRIMRNGNRALFFEPIVANSIFLYIYAARLFYDHITGVTSRDDCNDAFLRSVREMEDTISYYYSSGADRDTKFWNDAKDRCAKRLTRRPEFKEAMNHYRDLKEKGILYHAGSYAFAPQTWELIDKYFESKLVTV